MKEYTPCVETNTESQENDEVTVAVCQFASIADTAVNIARIAEMTRKCAESGALLAVFPEASSFAFSSTGEELAQEARATCADFRNAMCRIAKNNSIDMVVGMYNDSGAALADNVLLVVRADGTVTGIYHKLHLYDAYSFYESKKSTTATLKKNFGELMVFDIGPFRFGLVNCYDLRFPELSRALIDLGANTLIVCAGWIAGPLKELQWETLLKARAIENTSYVLAASQPAPISTGLSMVVDPTGLILGTVVQNEGIATATLSKRHLEEFRQTLPCLKHRRYRVVPRQNDLLD